MKSGNILTAGFIVIILIGGLLFLKDIADGISKNLDSISENIDQKDQQLTSIDYSNGQLIYVPIYSQIPFNNNQKQMLHVLLSVRNTDAKSAITFSKIDLYDTQGRLIKQYADSSISIGPLGTYEILIEQDDPSGGSGGNFYLQWDSDEEILEPYVEALLYGRGGTHTYSFNSLGRIVSKNMD